MLRANVDHEAKRVDLRLVGDITGPEYVSWLMSLIDSDIRTAAYDFVYDLLGYEGRVSHDDIAELAERYAALVHGRDAGAITVLVTQDEGFRFWAELFNVQFPNRRFVTAPSLAAADALLREAAAQRNATPPDP